MKLLNAEIVKWNLMKHRKVNHIETIAHCKNKLEGNCPFSDQKCWWNHQKVENNKDGNNENYDNKGNDDNNCHKKRIVLKASSSNICNFKPGLQP